ncbi:hypothetical protein [Pleomorphomonas sp. PLEO]
MIVVDVAEGSAQRDPIDDLMATFKLPPLPVLGEVERYIGRSFHSA